jgi:hypothetical protein
VDFFGYLSGVFNPKRVVNQPVSRRRALILGGALTGVALAAATSRHAGAADLAADLRIFESSTAHNSYPDDCDMRLDRLYIAEDLDLSLEVQFSRDLSDDESSQVQWLVGNDDAVWARGDFTGQPNPALITTTLSPPRAGDRTQAMVHLMYQGSDIAAPAPLRLITNDEYDAARAALAGFTAVGGRPRSELPLTVDLLARFLGQDSAAVGTPSVGVSPLNICDPRLTHRAGANWGADSVTNVPLLQYAADQPAAGIVAEAAARALLAQNADRVHQFFLDNPQAPTYTLDYAYSGNITLNRPLDAALSLHGVQFDGTLSGTIDAPVRADGTLEARDMRIAGTVSDLYDFDLEAGGAGALPAAEAAKVEIASVKHDVGKVFLVSFTLDATFDSLDV